MRVILPEDQGVEEKVFPGERGFFDGLKSSVNKAKDRVRNTLWGGNHRKGGSSCDAGFQEMNPPNSNTTGWKAGLGSNPKKDTNNFGKINEKRVSENDIGPTINITKFKETSGIIKSEIITPYQVMYYNSEGKGYQTVPKGTHIEYKGKTIYSFYNEKTKKHETYARVKTFTKSIGMTGRDFESVSEGYIRTPWFDGMLNKADKKTANVSQEKNGKIVSLEGFYGHDKKPIRKDILTKATINHLEKNVIPQLENTLAMINQNLAGNGKNMATEAYINNVPLKKTSGYDDHLKNLALKKTYERATQEIRSFTMNGQEVMGPTVASIIGSLQSKPVIWNGILNQATFISNQYDEAQRKARINGYKK